LYFFYFSALFFFPLPFLLRTCHLHTRCSLIKIPYFLFLPLYPFFLHYTSFVQLFPLDLPAISKMKLWPRWMLLQQSHCVAVKHAGNLVRKTLACRAENKTRAWRQYTYVSCMTSLGNLHSDCESEVLAARLPSLINSYKQNCNWKEMLYKDKACNITFKVGTCIQSPLSMTHNLKQKFSQEFSFIDYQFPSFIECTT
jgi:hypothetical protein